MNEIIESDVFFFISAIGFIILFVILVIVFAYLIRILRDVKTISRIAKEETVRVSSDIDKLRDAIKVEKFTFGYFYGFLKKFFRKGKVERRKK